MRNKTSSVTVIDPNTLMNYVAKFMIGFLGNSFLSFSSLAGKKVIPSLDFTQVSKLEILCVRSC
jgi:hypothetical protein